MDILGLTKKGQKSLRISDINRYASQPRITKFRTYRPADISMKLP